MKILSIDEAEKKAKQNTSIIITGVTGQDGSLMTDYLLANTSFMIFGGVRRLSVSNHKNILHLSDNERFECINFDLTDAHVIEKAISIIKPAYFINLAAQSFVKSSWDFPAQTWAVNSTGVLHILEAIHRHVPTCRVYNAGSSEEFGNVLYSPQDEFHSLRPRSPYGASKAAARHLIKVYRESYKMYALQGWLFNHEGVRRGEEFVTRKITKYVANFSKKLNKNNIESIKRIQPLELGYVKIKRDWSDAEDCVDAIWRMLNQEKYNEQIKNLVSFSLSKYGTFSAELTEKLSMLIKEYVVSSGEDHTIDEFVQKAFKYIGIEGKWEGEGINTKFIYESGSSAIQPGTVLVKINTDFYRPAEVENLCGDSSAIKRDLKWQPKTAFSQLIEKMVKNDLEFLKL